MDWKLFGTTFALIFVSELPDKTAFASLLLATRNDAFAVFCGSAAAFVVQSAVAVAFGSLLTLLPARIVHWGAGVAFVALAVSMWRQAVSEETEEPERAQANSFVRMVSAAFGVIFIAEWGDLTQLATATLAARYAAPITIFTSATLALWTVTAISVLIGRSARRAIHPKVLQRIVALVFVAVGVLLLATAP